MQPTILAKGDILARVVIPFPFIIMIESKFLKELT